MSEESKIEILPDTGLHGWQVINGSGWNHHQTANVLREMAVTQEELPQPPPGYAVLVAPISDKPLGLRCSLVKVLPRVLTAVIAIKPFNQQRLMAIHDGEPCSQMSESAVGEYLNSLGFTERLEAGWRHTDGTVAMVEMCDDGPEGDPWGWASENFSLDAEKVGKSLIEESQGADASAFFIKRMDEEIQNL